MKIKFRNQVLLAIILFIGLSCSKSEPPVVPIPPITTVPVPTTPPADPPNTTPPIITPPITTPPTTTPPPIGPRLVPIKISSPLETLNFKYEKNTARLTSIEEGANGKKRFLTYKNDLISIYEEYVDNEPTYYTDHRSADNLLINKVDQWNIKKKNTNHAGYYNLQYNSLKQLTEISFYSSVNLLLSTKTFSYDAAANVNSVITSTTSNESSTFTYDQKNGIFKDVDDIQLISIEFQHFLFNSFKNNVLIKSGTNTGKNYSCSYEYNSDSYPSQVTITESNVKTTYLITYKTL